MSNKKGKSFFEEFKKEIIGLLFLGVAVFILLSLLTYSSNDPPNAISSENVKNFMGVFGSYVAYFFFLIFGNATFVFPLLFVYIGILFILDKFRFNWFRIIPATLFLTAFFIILDLNNLLFYNNFKWDGVIFTWLAKMMTHYFGKVGTYWILILIMLISISLYFKILVKHLLSFLPQKIRSIKIFKLFKITKKNKKLKKDKKDKTKKTEIEFKYYYIERPKTDIFLEKKEPDSPKISDDNNDIAYEQISEIPPKELLNYLDNKGKKEDVDTMSRELEQALSEFGIYGNVINVEVGPMASLYEVSVKKGTKVSKITALDKDLALMLSKSNIRIIAPLPGRGTIGIEIPNSNREFVSLRELIETEQFAKSNSPLTIAFGKGMNGKPVIIKLDQLPHFLISGATMSGKSIGIHSIIMSLLFKSSYKDVKMILIDPKRLEFPYYNGIPHLLTDVVIEPKEAVAILKWAVYEMERRFQILAHEGYRDIQSYNKANSESKMPYLVIVIDELADLMMTTGQDVEFSIIRLAQKARAVGIHLVLATQRPSVDVITGTIKANFPSRVAYKTASKSNSRIILDESGAENLLGKGDFLFLTISGELLRGQGSYVSVPEIIKTVEYLKKIEVVEDEFTATFKKDKEISLKNMDRDELYTEVLRIIYNNLLANKDTVSTSEIQRRLSIGYNRAARIIDALEEDGIIDDTKGAKGHNVLISAEELEKLI